MEHRPFDIIVWGATGFVGKLVAEYLAENGPPVNILTRVILNCYRIFDLLLLEETNQNSFRFKLALVKLMQSIMKIPFILFLPIQMIKDCLMKW